MRVFRSTQTLIIGRSHSDREIRAPAPRTIPPANSLFLKFSLLLVCDYFNGSNGLVWLFLLYFFNEFRLNFFLLFSLFFLECYQFFFTFGWTLGSASTGLSWACILRKGTPVTFLLRCSQIQNDLCRSLKVRAALPSILSFLSFLSRKDKDQVLLISYFFVFRNNKH